jgi:2-polyprenyl-3-methyl-5-hydroxy-6-metoxy-1,4-benzoquinol methylase
MIKLQKFGVASKDYNAADLAKGDTYTRLDGSFPPTNLACKENPFSDQLKDAKYILDFGCGVGRNLPWIMENTNAIYVGLDPNTSMIQYFWEVQTEQGYNIESWKNKVQLYNDFSEIPSDINFDYIVTTFVLQHLGYRYINVNTMNLDHITQALISRLNTGGIWFLIEHDSEENWISRWTNNNNIDLDIYIRSYKGIPELCDRDNTAPNGGHHLMIWKKK